MIIEYSKAYLRDLYEEGQCKDKSHRYQPNVIKKYQKRVDTLMAATRKEDLFPLKSLGFEALRGEKEGLFSVKVDMQYRLEFSLKEECGKAVLTICTLQELSHHYK